MWCALLAYSVTGVSYFLNKHALDSIEILSNHHKASEK